MKNNKINWRERIEKGMSGASKLHTVHLPDGDIVTSTLVTITCIVHGSYTTNVGSFCNKFACKKCSFAKTAKNQRKTMAKHVVDFRKVHGDKYDYSLAPKHIKNNKVKIKMICPVHGLFEQRVIDHLRGSECRECTINSSDKMYILGVYDNGTPIALKYGITKSPDRRLKDIQKRTNYTVVRLGVWSFDDPKKCAGSEREIKDNVIPVLTQIEFNEGYTETCNVNLLDYIIKTIKEFGGVRWN